MSFFTNASNVNISGNPRFTSIKGNYNEWNDNRHIHNVNSHNTTNQHHVNSHNDNSFRQGPSNGLGQQRRYQPASGRNTYYRDDPYYDPRAGGIPPSHGGRTAGPQRPEDYAQDDPYDEDWYGSPPGHPGFQGPYDDPNSSGGYSYNYNSYNTVNDTSYNSHNNHAQTYYGVPPPPPPPPAPRPPHPRHPPQPTSKRTEPQEEESTPTIHVAGPGPSAPPPPDLGLHHVKSEPEIRAHTEAPSGMAVPSPSVEPQKMGKSVPNLQNHGGELASLEVQHPAQVSSLAVSSPNTDTSSLASESTRPSLSAAPSDKEELSSSFLPPLNSRPSTSASEAPSRSNHPVAVKLPTSRAFTRITTIGREEVDKRIEADPAVKGVIEKIRAVRGEDPLFFLKDIAADAIKILALIEAIIEGKVNRGLLDLALRTHAVVFVVIILSENKAQQGHGLVHEKKYAVDLASILKEIYAFIADKLRRRHNPLKIFSNYKKDSEKYKVKLDTWFRRLNNEDGVDLMVCFKEILRTDPVRREAAKTKSTSPSSLNISDVAKSGVALGSGSVAVLNGTSDVTHLVQNSHNYSSVNYIYGESSRRN